MDIDFPEIALGFTEHGIRLLQEPPHQLPGAGHRSIHHDHKIFNAVNLLRFQRFNQRHIAVQLHSIRIKHVVEGILVHLVLLMKYGKPAQKLLIIIPFPVFNPHGLQQASGVLRVLLAEGFHLRLHLLSVILPYILTFLTNPGLFFLIPAVMVIHVKFCGCTLVFVTA